MGSSVEGSPSVCNVILSKYNRKKNNHHDGLYPEICSLHQHQLHIIGNIIPETEEDDQEAGCEKGILREGDLLLASRGALCLLLRLADSPGCHPVHPPPSEPTQRQLIQMLGDHVLAAAPISPVSIPHYNL